ncbi:MAG: protein tyrosine phosphatase [Pseudomonadota bacterium]|nr:protein tyrosine phosphatase [Pseudomonadota bacterium]
MIIVSPLSAVSRLVTDAGVTHVLGLLGPESAHPDLGLSERNHLRLVFHDITGPMDGMLPPMRTHVERIVDFVENWDRTGTLLIHCWAGISRSTASAFTAMCLLHPQIDEHEIARELRSHSAVATPNRRIIEFADELLGRNGRMLAAVEAIGPGENAFEGVIFRWNVLRPGP